MGGCHSLYREALGETLQRLVGLDPDRIASCASAALRPWQQYEQAQSKPARLPFTQGEIDDGVSATREFILKRPQELASFLGTAVPAAPLGQPCAPLRLRVERGTSSVNPFRAVVAISALRSRIVLGHVEPHRRLLTVRVRANEPGEVAVRGIIAKASGGANTLMTVTGCEGERGVAAARAVEVACRYTPRMRRRHARGTIRVLLAVILTSHGGGDLDRREIKLPGQELPASH